MAAAIPAVPALSLNEKISLSPSSGMVGDEIEVRGWDFTPTPITQDVERFVDIYLSADPLEPGDFKDTDFDTYERWSHTASVGYEGASDEGVFTDTITIPAILNDGTDDEAVVVGQTYYIGGLPPVIVPFL